MSKRRNAHAVAARARKAGAHEEAKLIAAVIEAAKAAAEDGLAPPHLVRAVRALHAAEGEASRG